MASHVKKEFFPEVGETFQNLANVHIHHMFSNNLPIILIFKATWKSVNRKYLMINQKLL